jgi:hypothetical protein
MDPEMKRQLAESIKTWEARPRYYDLTPEVLGAVPDDLLEQGRGQMFGAALIATLASESVTFRTCSGTSSPTSCR